MKVDRNNRSKMTLYAEEASTTKKGAMLVLCPDSSPSVKGRVICPRGWTACPAKPNSTIAMACICASLCHIWLKASWNNTFIELSESPRTWVTS